MNRSTVVAPLLSSLLLLPGCTSSNLPDISPPPFTTSQAAEHGQNAAVAAITGDVWKRSLERDISLRIKFGLPIEALREVTYAAAEKDAGLARATLRQLRTIDPASLNEQDRITYEMLQWDSQLEADGLPFFWYRFPVTPYATPIRTASLAFSAFTF